MIDVAQLRDLLEAAELEVARAVILRLIRRAGRNRLFAYALRNHIVDFSLQGLVEQRHRDRRGQLVSNATTLAVTANAAITIAELLVVFDVISAHL